MGKAPIKTQKARLVKDISESKSTEEVLNRSEIRYHILAENSPVGIFHTDSKGVTTYVNPRWTEISGITADEAYGDGWLKSVHPDDKKVLLDGWNKSVREKTVSKEEYRFLKKDGSITWVIGQANPEKDKRGNIISYVGTITDITDRKLAEIALQDSTENIGALLNAPKDTVLIMDKNGFVININEITCKRLNVRKDDIIGKSIYDFLPEKASKLRKQKMHDATITGAIQYFEDFRGDNYFDNTVYPVKNSEGKIVRFVVIAQNITKRKQTDEELKLKEQQQSLILKSFPVVFYRTDCSPDLATTWISEQVKAITGFEPERFIKDKLFWTKRINPDDIDKVLSDYLSLFENGSYNADYRWKCSDGSYHWFSDNIVLIRDSDGKPKETIGFWIDISASKNAQEELKRQNNLLHILIDNSPDLIYYKDINSRFIAASNSVAEFMGTTPEYLIGKTDFDFYPKILAEQYFETEQKVINSGKPLFNNEEPRINEDGSITCILSTKVPLFNENKIIGLLGISRDITERKKIDETLKESEYKFRIIFESSRDVIILIEDGKIADFNKRMTEIFGYTRDELIGKSPSYFSPEFQVNGISSKVLIAQHIAQVLIGINVLSEIILMKKDGSPIDIELNLNKITISGKDMLMATLYDITVRKKYEEGLKLAKEKAEETNKLKSNFLANVSHELRTPMTGILGFSEILSETLKNEEDKHKADIILQGGKRLMNTLNLILDLSRVESDKIEVNREKTNISLIAKESLRLFEILARNKGISLCTDIEENVYSFLDEQLFEQVMSNLIKNSLLYTDKGEVKVIVKTETEDGKDIAVIKVIDTGIGIPEKSINIIFEPFRQVSEGRNRDFEGTGLGLTLARRYVELMEGKISVKSELNSGTEFTLKFNLIKKAEHEPKKIKEPRKDSKSINNYSEKNILIVEDDESSIVALNYILSDFISVDVTDNGESAICLAKNKKYDLIVMDIGLKGIDGIETTKVIRKMKGYENIPIVAVTAFVMDGDEEKFKAGGCSHYIAKPFNFKETKQYILNIFEHDK